jgi:hypothetical protein
MFTAKVDFPWVRIGRINGFALFSNPVPEIKISLNTNRPFLANSLKTAPVQTHRRSISSKRVLIDIVT